MTQVWTLGSLLQWTKQYFSEKGVENPRLDAEVLLSSLIGKDRLYLYVHFDQPMEQHELAAFREWVKLRAARVPVAYIVGRKEFMGFSFAVSPAVLIPRPETEFLVETALRRLKDIKEPRILDIGLGSGAVLVSLLSRLPIAQGVGTDISEAALKVACKNAEQLIPDKVFQAKTADLFPDGAEIFDAIVSNPPYIREADIEGLAPEVKQEPVLALAGGMDGLDYYRRILVGALKHLRPDGFLAVEIGVGQAADVEQIGLNNGWRLAETVPDYAGIDRVLVFEKESKTA